MNVYAVFQSGGKQYRVAPGDVVRVERLAAAPGETVELDKVFLVVNGREVHVGRPVLEGARVRAQVLEEGRGEKILVFKARRRKGYRKTAGHRQHFTSLRISEILFNGAVYGAQEKAQEQSNKAAAPVPAKRDDAAKGSNKKKRPERVGASAAKEDTIVPEKTAPPRPAEQPRADSGPSLAPAASERPPADSAVTPAEHKIVRTEEKPVAAGPSEVPAYPAQEQAPAIPSREEEAPPTPVRSGMPDKTPEKPTASDRRRIALAIAVALLLLALILLLWGKGPFSRSQSTSAPAPVTEQPADKVPDKARVPVPEKAIEDTTPVNKPSAPAQPPD